MMTPVGIEPRSIERLVTEARLRNDGLRRRMERDYQMWRLEWEDPRWADATAPLGMSKYVSNEPWTLGNRIVSILSSAKLQARVPYGANVKLRREFGEAKEQFFIGCLREADKRLLSMMMPRLQAALGFYIPIRGWYAGRAMLYQRQEDGRTGVDISPFDPMHTFYGVDSSGLTWVCHVTWRRPEELLLEYGAPVRVDRESEENASRGIEVLDFYDRQTNSVVANGAFLKPPTPHGAQSVPCFIGAVGSPPMIAREAGDGKTDSAAQGESIYTGLREGWSTFNMAMSDRLTLTRRSLERSYVLKSPGGRKRLQKNPYTDGATEIPLDVNEKLEPLELLEMAKDTDILLQQVSGELQRAGLPHTVYGELGQTLSGYAITTLNQGHELTVFPYVSALEAAYTQIAHLLCYQYGSGMYAPILAMGKVGRQYFQNEIDPAMVSQSDDIEINFTPKLPKDEPGLFAMAQIAREGPTPLLSDRTIRDEIVKMQNVDDEADLVLEQIGDKLAPAVMLMQLVELYTKRGDMNKAEYYLQDLRMMMMQPPGMPGAPAGPGGPGGPAASAGGGGGPPLPGPPPGMQGPPKRKRPEAKVNRGTPAVNGR